MKTQYIATVRATSDRHVITQLLTLAISASQAGKTVADRYPRGSVFVTVQPSQVAAQPSKK